MGDTDRNSRMSKGPVCYYLDELSKGDGSCTKLRALREALEALSGDGYRNFAGVFATHALEPAGVANPRRQNIQNYLEHNWFGDEAWWPELQPIEPAFTVGVIHALQRATEHCPADDPAARAIPIDAYWVIADSGFEVVVTRNERQVNLLFLTPPPPVPRQPLVWAPSSEIWSVRGAGASDAEVTPWTRHKGDHVEARGTVLTSKVIQRFEPK